MMLVKEANKGPKYYSILVQLLTIMCINNVSCKLDASCYVTTLSCLIYTLRCCILFAMRIVNYYGFLLYNSVLHMKNFTQSTLLASHIYSSLFIYLWFNN